MPELKTQKTADSVEAFLKAIPDAQQRSDSFRLRDIFAKATGEKPRMWGPSIVGFGDHHYTYESGREGDWFLAGFSPRKGKLSLYVMPCGPIDPVELQRLGKVEYGKSCLYIKRLTDIDEEVLEEFVKTSVSRVTKGEPPHPAPSASALSNKAVQKKQSAKKKAVKASVLGKTNKKATKSPARKVKRS